MKKRVMPFLLAMIVMLSSFAFFGEKHFGNGRTKEEAAQNAERRAAAAAKKKDTCYDEVKMEDCKQEKDGTWTCYAYSANHKGSCPSN